MGENVGEIYTKMELITPERAAELLKNNSLNRSLHKSIVNTYANQMIKGHWKLSGQTISISKNGNLIDGQHRLHAIIKSGIAIEMNVAYNVPEESFIIYDNLRTRSVSDAMYIMGTKNASNISAGIQFFYLLLTGTRESVFKLGGGSELTRSSHSHQMSGLEKSKRLDNQEVITIYNAHKDLIEELLGRCMKFTSNYKFFSSSQVLGISLFLIIEKKHDKNKVIDFFSQLFLNQNIENQSISNYREILIKHLTGQKLITGQTKFNYLKKCWNAYLKGKIINKYTVKPNEVAPEFL